MLNKANLGLVFFPAFDWKISSTHPERQERLLYTRDQLAEEGIFDCPGIREYNPLFADWKDIERVHVGAPSLESWVTEAHRVSAGGAIAAAKAYMTGEVDRSFALVRPPGHHAMTMVHGIRGFCTVNIEAIMIAYMRKHYGLGRVAIVDTDVHHGDGSQEIFYHDPDTLYISFHQDGRTLYPGTGFIPEFGGPQALGATVNIPLPPGTGDEGLMRVMDEVVAPILADFQPEIVINSAGQDNHISDPLANMKVTARGYGALVDRLQAHIAVLEGGYSVQEALPYVNTAIVLSMAGMDYDKVVEPSLRVEEAKQTSEVSHYIDGVIEAVRDQWRRREAIQKAESKKGDLYWKERKSIYYDETGITEQREECIRLYTGEVGWHSIRSRSTGGPYGRQDVQAILIPWQATARCEREAYDEALRLKKIGDCQRIVVLNRRKDIQEEI